MQVREANSANSGIESGECQEIEIRTARSLPEIEALRESWMAWPSHRDSDIDFYLMILQAYPEVVRPHVSALYRNGKPEAILVGRLERKIFTFKLGYLPILRSSSRCLTFVYGAIHGNGSPENTELLVREVMKCLKQDEADVAMLEFVPIASPLYHLAIQLPGTLSRDILPKPQGHQVMVVPDTIDEVYRQMSHARRKDVRRNVRKLQTHPSGPPKIICYRNTSEFDRLFHDVEEVAQKTYQRGLGAGFADTPDVRMRLDLAARKGWLRAYVLYVGDEPCAFWIGMLYGEIFVGEYTGYDPAFRDFSPGMFLMMQVIEGFCGGVHDTVKEVDFGLGNAEYKAALCGKNWIEATVFIFGPTLRGFTLKGMRTMTVMVDVCARRVLASTKLLPRLKRAWRDRLAQNAQAQSKSKNSGTDPMARAAAPPEASS